MSKNILTTNSANHANGGCAVVYYLKLHESARRIGEIYLIRVISGSGFFGSGFAKLGSKISRISYIPSKKY